jgi:putative transposase
VQDTFIMCCDGLKGLPDAMWATWPHAEVQLCLVHLVRSSLRYTAKKHWGGSAGNCARSTPPQPWMQPRPASARADAWRDRYPAMINTWEQSWGEFVPSLEFPVELSAVVDTTMKSSTVGGGSLGLPVGDEHFVVPFLLLDDRFLRVA